MATSEQALLQELMRTFRAEALDHIQTLNTSLLELERDPQPKQKEKLLQEAFRSAHSLKGAARAVNLSDIERLSHAMESILQQARDQGFELTANVCDTLYNTLDAIAALLDNQEVAMQSLLAQLAGHIENDNHTLFVAASPDGTTHADEPDTSPSLASFNGETIRVGVNKLDDLMAQVGELLVTRINANQRLVDVRSVHEQFERWLKTWREVSLFAGQLNGEQRQRAAELFQRQSEATQELAQAFDTLDTRIRQDTARLGIVTGNLQDHVRRVRMIPFSTLTPTLNRITRDAAHMEHKTVEFRVVGGEIELDKKVLETLKDPLMHLLRNAVVHGIETPEERAQSDKPETGYIHLTIRQRGSEIWITVQDDGRGFDVDGLRKIAEKQGRLNTDTARSADEIVRMAFLPGVSTATQVSDLSGRGVGLDVVRQMLEQIQGKVSIDTQAGQGATLQLIVPASLAMTRGLLVRVGKEQYALPLLAVERIVHPEKPIVMGGQTVLALNGEHIPLVPLATLLNRPLVESADSAKKRLAVVIAVAEQNVALLVDDVLTEQELAVKPLSAPLERVRTIAGAALLGTGEPVVVLNPSDLVNAGRSARYTPAYMPQKSAETVAPVVRVLVVDDSITTRTLEKNILEAAGFDVTTATDGLQALKRLQEKAVDIVVSDIQMPNMDGVELARTIRDTKDYAHLPIILVTSLESREDRQRGLEAGANAYIVKRGFDQAELLQTIRHLIS